MATQVSLLSGAVASAGSLLLQTNGTTTQATLDTSGNLGLGVTPSSWSTLGGAALEITQQGNGLSANPNALYYSANAYFASNSWRYAKTGYATQYYANSNAGSHVWNIAGSGTAGNAITFTQAMTLDASGNLGVGTTSPTNRFNVKGASGAGEARLDGNAFGAIYTSNGDIQIYTNNSAYSVKFLTATGAAESARFDNSGNLLVGTTSTGARVNVLSGSNQNAFAGYVNVASSTSTPALYLAKYDNDNTTSQVYVRFAYNQNTFTGGQINGNGANQAAFGSWSDRRLKENIVDLPSQLDKIMALRPVEFDYLQSVGGGHQIGFIAQELQTVYADSVGEDGSEEKHLTITGWSKTEARLVKAIQEQQAIITSLTARIEALEQA